MVRFSSRALLLAIWISLVTGTLTIQAAPPAAEVLFPKSTTGFVSAPNIDRLASAWHRTALSRLLDDEVMKPFGDDLRRQLSEKWTNDHDRFGLAWSDIEGFAAGEVAVGLGNFTHDGQTKAGVAIVVDVHGKEAQAEQMLKKLAAALKEKGAASTEKTVGTTRITAYDVPATGEIRNYGWQAVYFIENGMFVASDQMTAALSIRDRLAGVGSAAESLASSPAYVAVMDRCRSSAAGLEPHLHWFIEPIGFVQSLRDADIIPERRKPTNQKKLATRKSKSKASEGSQQDSEKGSSKRDLLALFRNQGFDSLRGIGGFLNFAEGDYGILHRTAIHAPQPFPNDKAVRMLSFPNGNRLEPQSWIFRDVAGYTSFRINIQNAFENVHWIWDEYLGEKGLFNRVLNDLMEDPANPFDLKKELIAHLGERVTLITDYRLPIEPTSERRLVAIEAIRPVELAAAVEKFYKIDPNAKLVEFEGNNIWIYTHDHEREPSEVQIEEEDLTRDPDEEAERAAQANGAPAVNAAGQAGIAAGANAAAAPSSSIHTHAVCVAHGSLLVANDLEIIKKVLSKLEQREQLENDQDFKMAVGKLDTLGAGPMCALGFVRTDEQYRAAYELFKQGKLPESSTLLARLLNAILGEPKAKVARQPKLDGSKLPDFDVVRRYLGAGGSYVMAEENGWFLVGFALNKQLPLAGAPSGPAAPQPPK